MTPIRVLIVDDDALVRAGLSMILNATDDVRVVAEAADGSEVLAAVDAYRPDVVLMDIRMPVLDGLAATRQLVRSGARTRVLMLTTFDLDEYVFESLRAGASGFLLKDAPAEHLSDAIRVVARGDSLLAPEVTRRVIDAFVSKAAVPSPAGDERLARLTPRELEVLGLLARGLSNLEISQKLFVSEATTTTHVSNVLAKLQISDRVQAVILAYECGLVVAGTPSRD